MVFRDYVKLGIAIGVCELAGVIGVFFARPAISGWYLLVVKPSLTPPSWVFAPVWILLYALMGIAAFLIWRKGFERSDVWWAMTIFDFQLALNIFWSVIFFGLHNPLSAFIELVLLWGAILATMIMFYRISRAAAWLLAPYILWVSFAGYLNYMIWVLNF